MWHYIKDLFAKNHKMAHVVMCKNCEHQFWGKTKFRYPKNMCPNCEAKSLIVNPSDISINERERMWRFLDDEEKDDRSELARHDLIEEKSEEIDYDGHWGNVNPGFLHETSEKIKEDLR